MPDIKCFECGALQKKKHIQEGKCWKCNTEFDVSSIKDVDVKSKFDKWKTKEIVYPKCPNVECDNHLGHTPPKEAFVVNVIEQGMMGKIFKAEATNMISCVKCGHIVGVAGKG